MCKDLFLSCLNPVNAAAHIIAAILFAYGLWYHNLTIVGIGVIIGILGHCYVCLTGWKCCEIKEGKKKKRG